MKLSSIIFAAIVATLSISSCEPAELDQQEHEPTPGIPYDLTKSQSEMVTEGNAFAFNLLNKVTEDSKINGKDFIFSPLSISFVLGALNNGATGQTSEEILSAIGFDGRTSDDINGYCRSILEGCPGVDELVKLKMANAVFAKEGFELKKSFITALSEYYDAFVRSMEFDIKALEAINSWCNEQTEGMIPQILEEIPAEACLFALNSIYFKGDWTVKFEKSETRKRTFTNIDGSTGEISMMHSEEIFEYSSNDIWATARLPYGNGSYSMYVLLPHEDRSMDDVLAVLDSQTWENEKNMMRAARLDMMIPSFETETNLELKDIMRKLGMERAFEPWNAEFKELSASSTDTYLGLLLQKSKIIVNEEGTEAAAVTIGGAFTTALPPSEPQTVNFHADRPFFYIIQEKSSNAIFFIGAKVRS